MPEFNFVVLYVKDPIKSAEFYAKLLGKPIVDQSEGFAMLPLIENVMLGLWELTTVVPPTLNDGSEKGGSSEISLNVDDDATLENTHKEWLAHGVTILQAPMDMPFGRTFVAVDADGHRIRVATPAKM
ncbi:VOC family protein [Lentilitoribacter sp. EG35]|uniref:VOC family protein n=1 Tax=Lentilitoribacter sp. EG35 TaxID=3234192 RepID=UPI0034613D6C